MKATILIATSLREEQCIRTINSIYSNDKHNNIEKILIIENGRRSNLEKILKDDSKYSSVRYLFSQDANKSVALNVGLKSLSRNDFIIFFDDDITIFPETIESYIEAGLKFGDRFFYGGPTVAIYEREPQQWQLALLPSSVKGLNYPFQYGYSQKNLFFLGFNWASFKSALDLTNGFDPDFGPGSWTGSTGQESNMMKQLNDKDVLGLYVPKAKVIHHVSKDTFRTNWIVKRSYRHAIETGLTTHKHSVWFTLLNPRHYLPILKIILTPEINLRAKYVKFLAMSADRIGIIKGLWLRRIKKISHSQ